MKKLICYALGMEFGLVLYLSTSLTNLHNEVPFHLFSEIAIFFAMGCMGFMMGCASSRRSR